MLKVLTRVLETRIEASNPDLGNSRGGVGTDDSEIKLRSGTEESYLDMGRQRVNASFENPGRNRNVFIGKNTPCSNSPDNQNRSVLEGKPSGGTAKSD